MAQRDQPMPGDNVVGDDEHLHSNNNNNDEAIIQQHPQSLQNTTFDNQMDNDDEALYDNDDQLPIRTVQPAQQPQYYHNDNPSLSEGDDDEDDDDDEDSYYPAQYNQQRQQQYNVQNTNRTNQQAMAQLQEQQKQREEEEEARKYYEPIEEDNGEDCVYFVKTMDENTEKLRWRVRNLSHIKQKLYSPEFEACGGRWRILLFPNGNNVNSVSIYLDVADAKTMENGWTRYARFQLSMLNQFDIAKTHGQDAEKRFNAQETDWGFREFVPLSKFRNPSLGFIVDDSCVIEAVIHVSHDPYLSNPHNYNSKRETGFIGFKNQGATCYMNSLLQTLYHIAYFRKAVYQMPTEEEKPASSIPLALQRVFHKLQYDSIAVDTKELTRSFGWDTIDSFLQHDVQELARVLMDNLEKKMENTLSKGTMKDLFEGVCKNYIKCINVEYESSRKETYLDLQLNVKGCKDVMQSFEQYIEVETLEGENQYQAEGHGLQDAKKGSIFLSFPPVLMLHLKRFEYDIQRDVMYKINDRYEFPLEMDLTRFLDPSSDSIHEDNTYCLFSILVHSGDVSGGHYYAYIKPYHDTDNWFKFDDEKVYGVRKHDAIDESFGGGEEKKTKYFWLNPSSNSIYKRFTNAYMLVYIRKSRVHEILKRVELQDVPPHLTTRFEEEKEQKEKDKRDKAEAWKFCSVKISTDEDLRNYQGVDLLKLSSLESIRILKDAPVSELKKIVQEKYGVVPEKQRFWRWERRQNKTNRPDHPFDLTREHQIPVEKLFTHNSSEVVLHLEVSKAPEDEPSFKQITKRDLLLFVKFYDPEARKISYVGSMIFQKEMTVLDVMQDLKQLAGLPEDESIVLYEEIRPDMIEPIPDDSTLKKAELIHGDIVIIQKQLTPADEGKYEYPTPVAYFEYLNQRIDIEVSKLEEPDKVQFNVELLKTYSFEKVVTELAKHLNTEPQFIRLTGNNPYGSHPVRPSPFRSTEVRTLKDMLVSQQQITSKLYYEILDVPLTEVENKKEVFVSWFNNKVEIVERFKILLPKDSTVSDLKKALVDKIGDRTDYPIEQLSSIRISTVHNNKYSRIWPDQEPIDKMNSIMTPELRAELVDPMELTASHIVQVQHFCKDGMGIRTFGHPFLLVINEEETVGQVKSRIQAKLQIKDEDYKKYKFAPLSGIHQHSHLVDDDVKFVEALQNKQTIQGMETTLGLEHKDPTPRNHSRYYDKPIVIKN